MDRKFINKLQRSFEKRGGRFAFASAAPPEIARAFLEELLDCPDCRAAVLEACDADNRDEVDIDSVLRAIGFSRDH